MRNEKREQLRGDLRARFPRDRSNLLPALHYIQNQHGYLPDWCLEVVGWHLGIPASEVYGSATSYSDFRIDEPTTPVFRICTGLSCKMNGSVELFDAAQQQQISCDESITKNRFSVEETSCGFLCPMAPAVQVNDIWHGRLTKSSLLQLLQSESQ